MSSGSMVLPRRSARRRTCAPLASRPPPPRPSPRPAPAGPATAAARSPPVALGAASIPGVARCEAISRAPAAASSTIRFNARSLEGTIASASSRALVRARFSSPSMRTTACAFPAEACPMSAAISDMTQLSRPEQQAFELQPAVAVLIEGLDHFGAKRGLPEEAMRRNALRDLPCPGGELAHLWRASRSRDQEVPRPALHRLRHFQRRVAVAMRFGEIQRLALVRRLERVLHLLQQLAPFALRGERAREAALGAPRPLARLPLGDALAQQARRERILRHGPELDAGAARPDGRQQRVRIRAHQQERRARRRLLQRLEQGVLGALVHRIGGRGDGGLAAPPPGPPREAPPPPAPAAAAGPLPRGRPPGRPGYPAPGERPGPGDPEAAARQRAPC